MKISDFFAEDYVNYSSYDNLRKIASLVDGQKNGARKVLYTILEKSIKEKIKVSQLGSKVAEYAEYLHGNLDGVIVNLAQDFPGTNNVPLLQKKGNFGTRFAQEASASRYIHTYGTTKFFNLFKKEDIAILKHQFFEGNQIEPMFYVPSLPILLLNGSEGLSSGFAQKILPRSPQKITQYIKDTLNGNSRPNRKNSLEPHYNGFRGTIEVGENAAQWLIKGIVERIGVNKVQITEVPVGYDLRGYLNVLDDLEEKKIIQGYVDKSEDDKFLFNVNIPSKLLKLWSDDELLIKLKLVKKVTENYTVLDENNKILVCNSAKEILDHYISVKLTYINNRKVHLTSQFEEDIKTDNSRYTFIKMIVDNKLIISKRKKVDIIQDLDKVHDIVIRDGSYDYLLNMNLLSLTEERLHKLEKDINMKKSELSNLVKKSIEQIWGEDL